MTDKQKEAAARALCKMRGIDPEKTIAHGPEPDPDTGFVHAVLLYSPAWRFALMEINTRENIDLAMEIGRQVEPDSVVEGCFENIVSSLVMVSSLNKAKR